MQKSFKILGYELEEKDVQDWVNTDDLGYEHFSDQQIVKHVQQSQTGISYESESKEDGNVHLPLIVLNCCSKTLTVGTFLR